MAGGNETGPGTMSRTRRDGLTWKCILKTGSFLISSLCLTANSRRDDLNWSICALRLSIWEDEIWDESDENACVCDCCDCSDEIPTERRLHRDRQGRVGSADSEKLQSPRLRSGAHMMGY